jgi:hypothetical protein
MLGKQIAIAVSLISVIFYQFSGVYVPDGFERPYWYKTKSALMRVLGATVNFIT